MPQILGDADTSKHPQNHEKRFAAPAISYLLHPIELELSSMTVVIFFFARV